MDDLILMANKELIFTKLEDILYYLGILSGDDYDHFYIRECWEGRSNE